MKLSASPLALGCSGVTLWCSNPISSVQSFKYVELNGGPLSDSIFFGILCVEIFFLVYHMSPCMTLMLSAQHFVNHHYIIVALQSQ